MDVTETIDQKLQALKQHHSQGADQEEGAQKWVKLRAKLLGEKNNCGLAESPTYCGLTSCIQN